MLVDSLRQNESPLYVAKVVDQHGNGVADSLPLGSGNLDVHLGRQRLPFAHPLRTLVLCHYEVAGFL